jgi:type IV pilus assembly protein PilY1
MVNASIDTDRWSETATGNYQDDALYLGYTKANIADASPITSATEWTDGGVIRLLTKESTNPLEWKIKTVISGVGPVTSGIARLQDRKNHKLWLYFGSGRLYYGGDDKTNTRYIMGVTDPCYNFNPTGAANVPPKDAIDPTCLDTSPPAVMNLTNLKSQATITSCALGDKSGWYISLDAASTTMDAERDITDPVSLTNGIVQFTTFKPAADVCKFGGDSYVWAVKYDDGCAVPSSLLGAKVLLQVSTGAFEEVYLKTALTDRDGRKMGTALTGRPPTPPPPIVTNAGNKPPKKIVHIQEK